MRGRRGATCPSRPPCSRRPGAGGPPCPRARRSPRPPRPWTAASGAARSMAGSFGSTGDRPDLAEGAVPAALLQDHLDRRRGLGKAHRLVEGARSVLRFGGGLPLAEDAGEAAGVEDPVGAPVAHLEEVLAEARCRRGAFAGAGPRALEHEAVEGEPLFGCAPGVHVVEAQGARRGSGGKDADHQHGVECHRGLSLSATAPKLLTASEAEWHLW